MGCGRGNSKGDQRECFIGSLLMAWLKHVDFSLLRLLSVGRHVFSKIMGRSMDRLVNSDDQEL